jgi:hypothetical protein
LKALFCGTCSSIQSAPSDGSWRHCPCGASAVRWTDPDAGRLEVWAADLDRVRVIGLNNQMIYAAFGDPQLGKARGNDDWRRIHRESCRDVDDLYLFHASRRDCWAVIIAQGETGDVKWLTQRPWPEVGDCEPAPTAAHLPEGAT